jgi:fatty-acyl-CoA synthase
MKHQNRIADAQDVAAIEAAGLAAFLPAATPYDILRRSAGLLPDAVAINAITQVDAPETDVRLTYATLLHKVRRAANLFRKLGVGTDDPLRS